ncbi:MAG: hypothetical protein QOK15_586 [Nocardioidaceae bacterium]|jgi:lysophospholipase L1-like esterase|nr:hypothetical protein [Nocardioidaceae bacterium]
MDLIPRPDLILVPLLGVLLVLLLGACTGSPAAPHARRSTQPARTATYAALGDSYTAAPFVPITDLAHGCFRSDHNYPALLARALDAHLRDVSCSGATTGDVLQRQVLAYGGVRERLRPQLDAVRRGTDLVTVGLGGNDGNLFGTLVQGCVAPPPGAAGSCDAGPAGALGGTSGTIAATGHAVARVLRAVHHAAPGARVVLVGYPRLVNPAQECRTLPLTAAARHGLARLEGQLDRALSGAARRTGSAFLDLRGLSRGHEICSAHPWVNGSVTDAQRAAAFHPFAVEQQAVAVALQADLER